MLVQPFLGHSAGSDNRTCELRMQAAGSIGNLRHVAIMQCLAKIPGIEDLGCISACALAADRAIRVLRRYKRRTGVGASRAPCPSITAMGRWGRRCLG